MDIFKLFFNHDQRLDKLKERNVNRTNDDPETKLADFMKPDPTYSKFYITGTQLENEEFGINTLTKSEDIINRLDQVFKERVINSVSGQFDSLKEALSNISIGQALVISETNDKWNFSTLEIDEESNVGHKKEEVANILQSGAWVLYKEPAHNGYDLHLFSMKNIYPALFVQFKPLVDDQFRFFSINSKRMSSERHFYFETWTLDKPPHGAEEVFPETII